MIIRMPDTMRIDCTGQSFETRLNSFDENGVSVELLQGDTSIKVLATSREIPLEYITLTWSRDSGETTGVKVLGDDWERSYGFLEWRGIVPERKMPWYCCVSNGSDSQPNFVGRLTECFGVKVRPAAFCLWQYSTAALTLTLDLRNGAAGVEPNGRIIEAAEILFSDFRDMSAFDAVSRFCKEMCSDPLKTTDIVYGSNNWYYAYGESSQAETLNDARFVQSLTAGLENRPFMVLDDAWQPSRSKLNSFDSGAWDRGNELFPDMAELAEDMKKAGVKPGIWVRFLLDDNTPDSTIPDEWRLERCTEYLDPSHPQVIEHIKENTRRLTGWGYELIKHDFSSFDIFGRWGFEMPDFPAKGKWHFYDRSRTSAEIVVDFYRAIHESAGSAVIIGCNTFSHLCAGLAHLSRTGDDTSGLDWRRTRKMGVNTLAFRLPQNNAFYAVDADCVGITGKIDWQQNREWLRLLAFSGTPLFVSCDPKLDEKTMLADLKDAFAHASVEGAHLTPVDWMENNIPERWTVNGLEVRFDWYK